MVKILPKETREEIIRLYDNGSGLTPAEIARQTGVSYSSVYGLTRTKEKGFASRTEYQEHLAKERQQRPENQGLSKLIKTRLKELGKNQSWLAGEIGITKQAVSLYVQGMSVPTDDLLEQLFSSLEVSYKTLDDLLE